MTYTAAELDAFALADLKADAEHCEAQAATGPFWPERGVTAESLLAYAARCRARIERYRDGGAHAAVLSGRD